MKKVFLLLSLMGLSIVVTSCGSKSDDPNRAALGSSDMLNSNLESMQIREKYGIKQDADISAHLRSVEIDLNDSGLFFAEDTPFTERPVYEGDKWSDKKIKRKVERAYRRADRGGKTPKGITWKKVQDKCEDMVITLDYAPEGSYEPADLGPLLREYYEVSELYLNVTNANDQNCIEYRKIQQGQEQIHRQFMRSANVSSNGTTTVTTQGATAGGNGTRTRIPYGSAETN